MKESSQTLEQKTSINWFPGHMAKAIKEIKEKLNLVDMVIEVLDARAVLSSANPIIQELVGNKCYLKVITKADIADDKVSSDFIDYYKKNNINAILVNLNKKDSLKPITAKIKEVAKPIYDKDIRRGLKPRNVRVMVIGIPNVGKSTLINLLAKRNSAPVGNMPGFTRATKWVKCEGFDLLDTPGILWPNLNDNKAGIKLALIGCIKEEILPLNDLIKDALQFLNDKYPKLLYDKYNIEFKDPDSYLEAFARAKGHLLKNNEIDYDRSILTILNDLKNGRIGKISVEELEV